MSSPDPHAAPTAFTTPQLAALETEIRAFDERSFARGQRYFQQRRVLAATIEPPLIGGVVVGSEDYETQWIWYTDNDQWDESCTCPLQFECKHAVALALFALNATGHQLTSPAFPVRTGHVAGDQAATGGARALTDLRAARNSWDRQRPLQRLLSGSPAYVNTYEPWLLELLEEDDPDLLCWRLAREIRARSGWTPRPLEAYSQRPDLEQRIAHRVREELTKELLGWAREKRKVPSRHVRFVLDLVESNTQVDFALTVRLTTPRIEDEPRRFDQLKQLRSQAQRTPGTLPLTELSLLNTVFDGLDRGGGWYSNPATQVDVDLVRRLLERSVDTDLIRWSDEIPAALAERVGATAGGPVRLQPQPVRVLPACVDGDAGARIELHCFFPDGDSIAIGNTAFVQSRSPTMHAASMVVAKGCCWIVVEEPPESLLQRFQHVGGLDIPADQRLTMTGMLASRFGHMRDALRARTRFHAVQPLLALDLRDDDWLQLRVFARGGQDEWRPGTPPPADTPVFEYTPEERWERYAVEQADAAAESDLGPIVVAPLPAPEPTDAAASAKSTAAPTDTEVWLEAPAPENTDPLLAWLSETGAAPGDKGRRGGNQPDAADVHLGWWLKASPARLQKFGEVWDRRPHGVLYLGNDRMRRLLSPSQRLFPKVKVRTSGVDFFQVSAEWETEGLQLTDADLARLRAATTRFVKLSSGWAQRDMLAARDEAAEVLADLGLEVGGGEQAVSVWQLAHAKPESLDAFERMGADAGALATLQRLRARIASFQGLPSIAIPKTVNGELRPYQKLGLDFLAHASSLGLGTILADDMGLGKTLQALTWIEHLRKQDPGGGPTLVVCPTSVVHNWQREVERFTPKLRVLLIRSGPERHALWEHLREYDLLVTNYALLRRDLERWLEIDLRAVILDEAQNIKNPDADVSRAALQLKAAHRLALTGTPLENRALDLWSIVQFVNPGYLGNRRHFAARYDRLDAPRYVRALLAAKLRPILLRRLKRDVAPELPERIEERHDCELTTGQRKLYLAELQRSRKLVDDLTKEPDGIRRNHIVILAALTRLRQICCHPALAKGRESLGSGKFDALFELVEPLLEEGHKVLVFSQFVECLKLLKAQMVKRKIRHHLLTGQTRKREEVVREFQESPDPGAFLISLKAGGTGLNLTAASYVVVFDPWWNPAVEAQAIDRTHRIGQDRTVIAYRLLAIGTIEEKIWELQQKKAALVRDVLGEDGFGRSLTREDLSYLLEEA